LDNIYVPVVNEKFEKLVYDSIAIIFGYFPTTEVSKTDYNQLFNGNWLTLILACIWLYSVRLLIFVSETYFISLPMLFLFKRIRTVVV